MFLYDGIHTVRIEFVTPVCLKNKINKSLLYFLLMVFYLPTHILSFGYNYDIHSERETEKENINFLNKS